MGSYEYKVVPAPSRGTRGRQVKGPEGRFAHSLELLMNQMAAEGWEYQRAETLPSEEKPGLVSAPQTVYRNVLVFRRARSADLSAFDPRHIGNSPDAPLLLPPVESLPPDDGTEPAEGDPGLSGLLRRRAARMLGHAPSETAEADEPAHDFASLFTEDGADDGEAPTSRSAAE